MLPQHSFRPNLVTLLFVGIALPSVAEAQNWSQMSPANSPSARSDFGFCYDSERQVSLLFGGYNATQALGDTWSWNGFGWVLRSPSVVPPARWGHRIVFDHHRARAVMVGGFVPGGGISSEIWEWDGSNWRSVFAANAPGARAWHGLAYDSWRRRVLLFGGFQGSAGTFTPLADTWTWDGTAWTQIQGAGPSARGLVAMSFDDAHGQAVLFGGDDGTQDFSDTWTFNGVAWQQQLVGIAPAARRGAMMVHDALCGETVLIGGADHALVRSYDDSWIWDGGAWNSVSGTLPPGRHGGEVAFDSNRGETILFGGRDATLRMDTWRSFSDCSRSMSVITPPYLGLMSSYAYNYPPAASGHYCFHLVAAHNPGAYPAPIPGFGSLGLARVDLFTIFLQPSTQLDWTGVTPLSFQVPNISGLTGYQFDVQSVDVSLQTNTIFWAQSDAEMTIQVPPPLPVVSFTATPRTGSAPLVVQFTDTSTNGPNSWQWDFDNDGVVDSTQRNPTWTYNSLGAYSVRLVARNVTGTSSSTQAGFIVVGPDPALNMVRIAPGQFQMGSAVAGATAAPVHQVTISRPFWMAKYEVTQQQYQALMGSNPSAFQGPGISNSAQRPVENLTWQQAMAYCAALNTQQSSLGLVPAGYEYRLPTEAEWEYCCRAGTTTEWNTGTSLSSSQANIGGSETRVVGSYPGNAWGLCDMHGNVWELCLDSWNLNANYPSGAVVDPYVGTGTYRVDRGGAWRNNSDICRSARRGAVEPTAQRRDDFGFRVVLAPIIP